MADPTPTPTPTPTPATAKRPHRDVPKEVTDEVALAKKVSAAAKVSTRVAPLATRGITGTTTLDGQIQIAEDTLMPDVVTKKKNAALATAAEGTAKSLLNDALKVIIKGVERTYSGNKAQQAAYLIGKIRADREGLTADIESIVTRARADTLTGVTAADCDGLANALGPWQAADDAQRAANDLSSTAVQALRKAAAQIAAGRRDIQMAADLIWPCDKADSGPHRLAFGLPAKRPFVASNVKAPA